MRSFLAFAVASRINAVAVATGLALSSVILAVLVVVFPPLFFLGIAAYFASAAIVALAALKFGVLEGLVVMLGPALFWLAPMLAANDAGAMGKLMAVPVVSTVGGIFLPLLLMVGMLRQTHSQAWALGTGALLLMAVATLFHLTGFDPMRWLFAEMLPALKASTPEVDWRALEATAAKNEPSAVQRSFALGSYMANSFLVLVLTLSLARWWHAILDNPGGFGREFRSLRFSRRLGYVAVPVIALALLLDSWLGQWGLKLLPTLLVLPLLQGVAVAHAVAREKKAGKFWLIALYVLPILNPLLLVVVVIVGLMDPWIGFRERWARV